jgi:hypothetical protein
MMLVNTVLLLICALICKSWMDALLALTGETLSAFNNPGVIVFLFLFVINALLTFGLLKVIGIARVLTILEGLSSVAAIALFIAGYRYIIANARDIYGDAIVDAAGAAVAASSGLFAGLFKSLLSFIPPTVLAQIGIYLVIFIGPYILQLLSMLILLVCGKDFKKPKVEAS